MEVCVILDKVDHPSHGGAVHVVNEVDKDKHQNTSGTRLVQLGIPEEFDTLKRCDNRIGDKRYNFFNMAAICPRSLKAFVPPSLQPCILTAWSIFVCFTV